MYRSSQLCRPPTAVQHALRSAHAFRGLIGGLVIQWCARFTLQVFSFTVDVDLTEDGDDGESAVVDVIDLTMDEIDSISDTELSRHLQKRFNRDQGNTIDLTLDSQNADDDDDDAGSQNAVELTGVRLSLREIRARASHRKRASSGDGDGDGGGVAEFVSSQDPDPDPDSQEVQLLADAHDDGDGDAAYARRLHQQLNSGAEIEHKRREIEARTDDLYDVIGTRIRPIITVYIDNVFPIPPPSGIPADTPAPRPHRQVLADHRANITQWLAKQLPPGFKALEVIPNPCSWLGLD